MDPTQDLEKYLLEARPLTWIAGKHGAHPSYRLLFEGGVYTIVKPADEVDDQGVPDRGKQMVAREVAAWKVAQALGWSDLVGTTVLRPLASRRDPTRETQVSVQALWPDPEDEPDLSELSDDEIWRAGVFDVVTHTGDRSHNWLGVHDPKRLKLIDHGHAFEFPGFPFQSAFCSALQGQVIPGAIREALRDFYAAGPGKDVVELLGREQAGRTMERVERLFQPPSTLQAP